MRERRERLERIETRFSRQGETSCSPNVELFNLIQLMVKLLCLFCANSQHRNYNIIMLVIQSKIIKGFVSLRTLRIFQRRGWGGDKSSHRGYRRDSSQSMDSKSRLFNCFRRFMYCSRLALTTFNVLASAMKRVNNRRPHSLRLKGGFLR